MAGGLHIYRAMRPLGLFRLILLIALMMAPVGMVGRHAAMAAPPAEALGMSAGHCAGLAGERDREDDKEAPAASIDCMLACACTPPTGSPAVSVALLPDVRHAGPPAILVGSHGPKADPPPPRRS